MGKLVETMLQSGVKLGVSSRGSGNVDEGSGNVSDFDIIKEDARAQRHLKDGVIQLIKDLKIG